MWEVCWLRVLEIFPSRNLLANARNRFGLKVSKSTFTNQDDTWMLAAGVDGGKKFYNPSYNMDVVTKAARPHYFFRDNVLLSLLPGNQPPDPKKKADYKESWKLFYGPWAARQVGLIVF